MILVAAALVAAVLAGGASAQGVCAPPLGICAPEREGPPRCIAAGADTAMLYPPLKQLYGCRHRGASIAAAVQLHPSGRAAMRMLENEGFAYRNYIDIFDGGPTLTVETDQIATIRQSQTGRITALGSAGHGIPSIVAHGLLAGFRACHGSVAPEGDGIMLDEAAAGLLGVTVGDTICHVPC